MTGVAVGLDFGTIMTMGAAANADLELLAETLPDFETVILSAIAGQSEEE